MSPNGATSPLASSEGHQLQQQQPGAPLSGPLPQAQSAYAPSRLGAQYRGPVSEGGAAPGGNSNALVLQGPQAAQAANHGGPAAAGAVAGAGGQGERRASGPAQMQPPQGESKAVWAQGYAWWSWHEEPAQDQTQALFTMP